MRGIRFLALATALASAGAAYAGAANSAAPASASYSMADFDHVAKYDAHVHVNTADPALVDVARADGFELLSINVDYPDFPPIEEQARVAEAFHRADPNHFHFATTFSMKGFPGHAWFDESLHHIQTALAGGAVAVKVWKNVGMVEKDAAGHHIFIDNPGFSTLIASIERLGIPLIAHQGEPYNCWLPLDKMTNDNDRDYFREHPQYHMFLHPHEPSYEALMAARDHFVSLHPRLRFVGAHMASLEWSVDRLAAFLDKYPNANVDLAARMTGVQVQSARDYPKVRAFFIKYADRLIYATDLTQQPGDSPDAVRKEADAFWRSDWKYLATGETQPIDAIKANVKGLALPRAVIDQIYYRNAVAEYRRIALR